MTALDLLDQRAARLTEQARLLTEDLAACLTAEGKVGTAIDLVRVRRELALLEEARKLLT